MNGYSMQRNRGHAGDGCQLRRRLIADYRRGKLPQLISLSIVAATMKAASREIQNEIESTTSVRRERCGDDDLNEVVTAKQ